MIIKVYYFFSGWLARQKNYGKIQEKTVVPKSLFLKHVPTRWLTTGPSFSRLREQMTVLFEYFVVYTPKRNPSLMKSNAYKEIIWLVKQPTMKAECQFVVNTKNLFTRFNLKFQGEEPLVHKLYTEPNLLVLTLSGRILKPKATKELDELTFQPLEDEKNFVLLLETVLSDEIVDCLESLDELQRCSFMQRV